MTVNKRPGAKPSGFSKKARRARARWRCSPRITRRVVAKLQQLQSDAVLISGDLFDGSKADLDALLEPWKGLSAPAESILSPAIMRNSPTGPDISMPWRSGF